MNNSSITVEFTPTNIENLFIISDLDTRLIDSNAFFSERIVFLELLTKIAAQINILIQDMVISLILFYYFHFQMLIVGKNSIAFRGNNISSVDIVDNKKIL